MPMTVTAVVSVAIRPVVVVFADSWCAGFGSVVFMAVNFEVTVLIFLALMVVAVLVVFLPCRAFKVHMNRCGGEVA